MKKHIYKIRLAIALIIFILGILALCGLAYPIKLFHLQLGVLLQKSLIGVSFISATAIIILIILTSLLGRFYCSILCPFGVLQEIGSFLRGGRDNKPQKNHDLKYFLLCAVIGTLLSGTVYYLRYLEPYSIFAGAVSLSTFGIIFTLCVLVLVLFKNRFFCTNICPIGTFLGIISKFSYFKIHINKEKCQSCGLCSKICPSGCITIEEENKAVDNEMCINCMKCVSKCPHDAMEYTHTAREKKFQLTRRKLLLFIGGISLISTAYITGLRLSENLIKKFKNVILPPGAKNTSEILNRCLNCNLCVKNCPSKIIVKGDEEFPVVHIDYTQGDRYCRYDCRKCGEICPSGAIQKLPLSKKQNTRIAIAKIDEARCTRCGHCISACPKGAIYQFQGRIFIYSSLCIGCAKCKTACRKRAIVISSIEEQTKI